MSYTLSHQLFSQLMRQLPRLSVPLAEYEYVFDDQAGRSGTADDQSGEIDPNVLSAGGFPTIVLQGALDLVAERNREQACESDFPDVHFVKQVECVLDQYPLQPEQRVEFIDQLQQTFRTMGEGDAALQDHFLEQLPVAVEELQQVNSSLKAGDALAQLVGSVEGVSRVLPGLWFRRQQRLVSELRQLAVQKQALGFYRPVTLARIVEFVEIFVATSGLAQPVKPGNPRVVCKIPWEASLGYAAAERLQALYPADETQVWIDLFADTGLYAQVPLDVLTVGWSKRQRRGLQAVLQHGVNRQSGRVLVRQLADKPGAGRIEYDFQRQEAHFFLGSNPSEVASLPLPGVLAAADVLALSPVYNMEAYFWGHVPLPQVQLNDPCQRWLYLSHLLNAKACTLHIYQQLEQALGWRHRRPATQVIPGLGMMASSAMIPQLRLRPNQPLVRSSQAFSQPQSEAQQQSEVAPTIRQLIVKEAGQCSTGGKEVAQLELAPWQATLIQVPVDSHLFLYQPEQNPQEEPVRQNEPAQQSLPQPLHGHVRHIGIVNTYGKVVSVGFVVKLASAERFNSSAYQSWRLFFDERGRFVYGSWIKGNQEVRFEDLGEAGLQPALTWSVWQKLLKDVRQNWLVSTLYINLFLAQKVEEKLLPLLQSGWLSPDMYPAQGLREQDLSEHQLDLTESDIPLAENIDSEMEPSEEVPDGEWPRNEGSALLTLIQDGPLSQNQMPNKATNKERRTYAGSFPLPTAGGPLAALSQRVYR